MKQEWHKHFLTGTKPLQVQSAAGRRLFAISRREKVSQNDADRLRKYLTRFGLNWEMVAEG
ncbi:hypothetical protein D3W54_01750 [Komagataeibacter medellinensis]|uniref:Transcriptional regulator n=1 Tax=Komagataeibacter medellinensis TaxID=1177712 RepID=A0ABQ6VSJ2_9PROT|nr:hypothetical protein D3W54_01750 [Komagataeibacter medellinensis]